MEFNDIESPTLTKAQMADLQANLEEVREHEEEARSLLAKVERQN